VGAVVSACDDWNKQFDTKLRLEPLPHLTASPEATMEVGGYL
jgi:hypothetical protein